MNVSAIGSRSQNKVRSFGFQGKRRLLGPQASSCYSATRSTPMQLARKLGPVKTRIARHIAAARQPGRPIPAAMDTAGWCRLWMLVQALDGV